MKRPLAMIVSGMMAMLLGEHFCRSITEPEGAFFVAVAIWFTASLVIFFSKEDE